MIIYPQLSDLIREESPTTKQLGVFTLLRSVFPSEICLYLRKYYNYYTSFFHCANHGKYGILRKKQRFWAKNEGCQIFSLKTLNKIMNRIAPRPNAHSKTLLMDKTAFLRAILKHRLLIVISYIRQR